MTVSKRWNIGLRESGFLQGLKGALSPCPLQQPPALREFSDYVIGSQLRGSTASRSDQSWIDFFLCIGPSEEPHTSSAFCLSAFLSSPNACA